MMRPIKTLYRGRRFRPRLEARWAAFFDLMGWQAHYEPFDLNGWIPDFILHGANRGGSTGAYEKEPLIERLWAQAANEVQWRGAE